MKNILKNIIVLSVIILGIANPSFTQEIKPHILNNPRLNGNDFIINGFIPNPFLTTHLKSGLGYANSISTEIPLLTFRGDTLQNLKLTADISYINGSFEYQNAIADWAAIYLNFGGIARLGTNTASILASGVTANTNFQIGMLFKLKEYKKSLFSTSFSIKNSTSTILNIYPFIKGLTDSTYQRATDHIVNNFNPLNATLDLRSAYSPSKEWSILSYLQGSYGETLDLDSIENKFSYIFGGSVNYNLNPVNRIPIAFGAGFKLTPLSPTLNYSLRLTQSYVIQIAYTGRKDFSLSFESNYVRIPVEYTNITLNLTSYAFNWTYYF